MTQQMFSQPPHHQKQTHGKFNNTPTKSRPTDPRRLKHKVDRTLTLTDSIKGGLTMPALEATKKKKRGDSPSQSSKKETSTKVQQLLLQDMNRFKGKATSPSTQRLTSPPLLMPDNSTLPSSNTDRRKQSKKDKGKKAMPPSTQQPSNRVDGTLTKAPPPQPETSMQLTSNNSVEGTST
jgi:hypothetical protein